MQGDLSKYHGLPVILFGIMVIRSLLLIYNTLWNLIILRESGVISLTAIPFEYLLLLLRPQTGIKYPATKDCFEIRREEAKMFEQSERNYTDNLSPSYVQRRKCPSGSTIKLIKSNLYQLCVEENSHGYNSWC